MDKRDKYQLNKTRQLCSYPCAGGLEGAFNVVFKENRGHVEAMAAVSLGQSEVFHSVNKMRFAVLAGRRLDDKSLVFQNDDASADKIKAKSIL